MVQEMPMMVVEDQPRRSGCLLLTPVGCLVSLCLLAFSCVCLVPLFSAVGIGAVAALFLTNTATDSNSVTQHLENAEATRLEINDGNAAVNIVAHNRDEIVVDYKLTVYSYSTGAAQTALQDTQVSLVPLADNSFALRVDESEGGFHFYDITYTIQVPFEMKDIVLTTDEDVRVEGVTANMIINTGISNINLLNVGGTFTLTTTSGNIDWRGTLDNNISSAMSSTSGNIQATLQGKGNVRYTATSSSGSVICPLGGQRSTCTERIGDATAQLTINSDSGNITVLTSGQ